MQNNTLTFNTDIVSIPSVQCFKHYRNILSPYLFHITRNETALGHCLLNLVLHRDVTVFRKIVYEEGHVSSIHFQSSLVYSLQVT